MNKLEKKYINKLVNNLGIAIHIYRINEIIEYEMIGNILMASTIFEIIFYRFFPEEIITGKIIKQYEDKIIISNPIFNKFEVQASDLFENAEFDIENGSRWIWNYKGNKLRFYTNDIVKFKIKNLRYQDVVVECVMNEQGLGPIVWWE
ncbi:MAG: RNA polymerase III subunit Rbc25 domain-containing protein [Romboutsia sp.]|nr:RNA polymerase III subunit Rbc25 domain-containing protein [Romboutsia sp.]